MNLRLLILSAGMLFFFGACKKESVSSKQGSLHELTSPELDASCDSTQFEDILFKDSDGTLRLSGGDADSQHFDVSGWELEACNLGFCFCHEHFSAVYEPRYTSMEQDAFRYDTEDAFIVVYGGGKSKAYSLELMVKHEVVNDTLNGDPILVAYCVLAELPIVYSRTYCGEELTFALSGYTYYEDQVMDGVQAFVLWDRETESLWWPFADDALAGPMQGAPLREYPVFKWKVLTWADLQQQFPNAQLLATDIVVDAPVHWPSLEITAADCN